MQAHAAPPDAGSANDSASGADPAPGLRFVPQSGLREVFQHSRSVVEVEAVNTGFVPARILGIKPLARGASESATSIVVPPGGRARVPVAVDVADRLGKHILAYRVNIDDTSPRSTQVRIPVFVQSAYTPEIAVLDFGVVTRASRRGASFTLRSFESPAWRIEDVVDKPAWLNLDVRPAQPVGQAFGIEATLGASVPRGMLKRTLRVRTTVPQQPEISVLVLARVFESVVADPFPLEFGAVHEGQHITRVIELRDVAHAPLAAAGLSSTDPRVALSSNPCGTDCIQLHVALQPTAPGTLAGAIDVRFAGREDTLQIPYSARVVSRNTRIMDLGHAGQDAEIVVGQPRPEGGG